MPCIPPHIVIVGGGMVGCSLSLLLSQYPDLWRVTLLEQFPLPSDGGAPRYQPSFDQRSTALSAGTVDVFQQLGCWETLCPHAAPIHHIHVSDRGHFGGATLHRDDYGVDALGQVIENAWLGQVLLHTLQQSSVTCLSPATVTDCSPRQYGYRLNVNHQGQTTILEADLVLIADGADSPLRKALGITVTETDYQQVALIANVALSQPHEYNAYERFTEDGPMALLPLPSVDHHHRAALVWTLPRDQQAEIESLNAMQRITRLHQRFGFRAGRITEMGETHVYPLRLVQADEQVRSHLALMGNAAHFLHPVAGAEAPKN